VDHADRAVGRLDTGTDERPEPAQHGCPGGLVAC
jgi:hypothetical protein